MKLNQKALLFLIAVAWSVSGIAVARAQQPIWDNYRVIDTAETYTPLNGGIVIPPGPNVEKPTQFLNSFGTIDMNDGTADSIPVGFTFDYNGMLSNSINVNVNGWVTINPLTSIEPAPIITSNNNSLFSSVLPNNTIAPYWGDHYYRTIEPGYTPSQISYLTYYQPPGNPNSVDTSQLESFTVEWKNMNVNDPTNPHSVASFQMHIFIHRTDTGSTPSQLRATFEFDYAPSSGTDTVETIGDAVGAEDSAGLTHLNALFQSSQFNGESTRLSTAKTSCWPPTDCTPGIAIRIEPITSTAGVLGSGSANSSIAAYPNPFTQSTTLNFTIPESGAAEVTIVNTLGEEVAGIFDGEMGAGEHSFTWDANGMAQGTYWFIVRMNGQTDRIPIVLQR